MREFRTSSRRYSPTMQIFEKKLPSTGVCKAKANACMLHVSNWSGSSGGEGVHLGDKAGWATNPMGVTPLSPLSHPLFINISHRDLLFIVTLDDFGKGLNLIISYVLRKLRSNRRWLYTQAWSESLDEVPPPPILFLYSTYIPITSTERAGVLPLTYYHCYRLQT